jgi:hypothetical protein
MRRARLHVISDHLLLEAISFDPPRVVLKDAVNHQNPELMEGQDSVQSGIALAPFLWLPSGSGKRMDEEVVHRSEAAFDDSLKICPVWTCVADTNPQGLYQVRSAISLQLAAIRQD